ncbi:MAG: 3'-5' exonuclease [Salibacteraceae bacterium]
MELNNILFLDIETVPAYRTLGDSPDEYQKLWEIKAAQIDPGQTPDELYPRAGIYAEFGKIICISVGHLSTREAKRTLRIKSYSGVDERQLLTEFAAMLNKHFGSTEHYLCAHNGREFDFPYIARRLIINQVPLPGILDLSGKKPWEVGHIDTMQLWKFGDFKSYTSLRLLAHIFGLPTPKDDIDGSQVYSVFYDDGDLPRIVEYCEKDVQTLVQVYLRMKQQPTLDPEEIETTQ